MRNYTENKRRPQKQLYNIKYETLAFQWDGQVSMTYDNEKLLPVWLMKHIRNNEIMSVVNYQEQYVKLGNKRGQYKALPGDWICRDMFGHLFVISEKTFPKRAA